MPSMLYKLHSLNTAHLGLDVFLMFSLSKPFVLRVRLLLPLPFLFYLAELLLSFKVTCYPKYNNYRARVRCGAVNSRQCCILCLNHACCSRLHFRIASLRFSRISSIPPVDLFPYERILRVSSSMSCALQFIYVRKCESCASKVA
jgi:hypothetical protein